MANLEWMTRTIGPGRTQKATVASLKGHGWEIYTTTPSGRVLMRKRKPLPVEVEIRVDETTNHENKTE